MPPADNSSVSSNASTERKVWETPTVIVGATGSDTGSLINNLGIDGRNPTFGTSYGS